MQNLKPLASLCSWAGQFESYLVRNPEDSFLVTSLSCPQLWKMLSILTFIFIYLNM